MGTFYKTASNVHRGGIDLLRGDQVEKEGHTAYVRKGIKGANFVEMDLL